MSDHILGKGLRMRFISLRTSLSVVIGAALSVGMARANDYTVDFTSGPAVGYPVVGTGTFSFDGSYGDGTYYLSSLTNYDIDFIIDGTTFTNSDIDTVNFADVEVVIYNGGTDFFFDTDCTSGATCYGPYGGSLDFTNGSYSLTTEPNYYGSTPLDLYMAEGPDGSTFGLYGTNLGSAATPEPETFLLLGTGLAGMLLRRFRRPTA
jgi:hypothetical protein